MISCSYCGRENDDAAAHCKECGSELKPSVVPEDFAGARWTLSARGRLGLRAGLGAILLCSAIYYAAARVFFDLHEIAHGGPIGKPGIYAVGMLFIPIAILLGIGSAIFTLAVFSNRSPEGWHGLAFAILTLATMALLFIRPITGFWLPAYFLGKVAGSSIAGHVGSAIQILSGGLLLGWFDRWRRKYEARL